MTPLTHEQASSSALATRFQQICVELDEISYHSHSRFDALRKRLLSEILSLYNSPWTVIQDISNYAIEDRGQRLDISRDEAREWQIAGLALEEVKP